MPTPSREPVGEVGRPDPTDAFSGVEAEAGAYAIRRQTQFGDIRRRFLRNRLAVVGLAMVAIVFVVAIFAPLLAPYDPYQQNLLDTQASPSAAHWFGTDELGRDLLSRVIYGSRIAVVVGLTSMLLSGIIGVALGAVSGYFGGAWDTLIMRVADVFFAFPLLIGAILIILVVGRGVAAVVLALVVFAWAVPARLLRSTILSIRESEYVEAARSLGARRGRIIVRHVLPNAIAPVLIYSAVNVAAAIVAVATLSFLGAGVSPDTPEWGNMIAAGRTYFGYKDYLWAFPAAAVVFTVLGFVFVGDGLRDALDPRLR
jgi:ABC-type dipeptide/oligopeptide/nickel transport system permease subunit